MCAMRTNKTKNLDTNHKDYCISQYTYSIFFITVLLSEQEEHHKRPNSAYLKQFVVLPGKNLI